MSNEPTYTVFASAEQVANGDLSQAAQAVKSLMAAGETRAVLVFADDTGQQVDVDLRSDVAVRLPAVNPQPVASEETDAPRRPGRPKLGVVGREVTLLPRHWDWLNVQPGGASVTLRKLVEIARLGSRKQDRIRAAREATYRFIVAIAGDRPGFEEASRALFAGDQSAFAARTRDWPPDIYKFAHKLAAGAFTTDN